MRLLLDILFNAIMFEVSTFPLKVLFLPIEYKFLTMVIPGPNYFLPDRNISVRYNSVGENVYCISLGSKIHDNLLVYYVK